MSGVGVDRYEGGRGDAGKMMDRDSVFNRWPKNHPTDPPRHVPMSVRLHMRFGGFANQFGWLFFGFGMVFVWIFGGSTAIHNFVFFSGDLVSTEATVTEIAQTNVQINDREVCNYVYSYHVEGKSYLGATKGFAGYCDIGDSVAIEYCVNDHARSRIPDMSIGSLGVFFGMIFPVVGLGFIFAGQRKAGRGARLLRDGKLATGSLIKREPTNTTVNNQRVYKYTFEFKAEDNQIYTVSARSHLPHRFAGETTNVAGSESEETDDIPAGVNEPLVHDEYNPSVSVLLDDLPGEPRFDEHGDIAGNVGGLILRLMIPGAALLGHLLWFLHVIELV
jgi:hypothetical protein